MDAGTEASIDGGVSCFPPPRGFDPGFAKGVVALQMMPLEVRTVALDHQGRVLVAGAQGMDSFIARITTDGKVDTTFATKGIFTQSFGAQEDAAEAIAVDAQDRVLFGGGVKQGVSAYPYVARLTPAGAIDASFMFLGTTSLGRVLAIAPDQGGLYAMGEGHFVLRLLDDGTEDAAFTLVQGMGSNIAGIALADGVAVLDLDGTIAKYGKDGTKDASFGGQVFGKKTTASVLVKNGDGYLTADNAPPSHVAILDSKGAATAMSADIAMSITSLGVACNRIVLGGGSNGDAQLGLLGLDTKPVTGDKLVDSYPVVAQGDAGTGRFLSLVQPDGRVIWLESVLGTGSIAMARASP